MGHINDDLSCTVAVEIMMHVEYFQHQKAFYKCKICLTSTAEMLAQWKEGGGVATAVSDVDM